MAPISAESAGRRFHLLGTLGEGTFGTVYLAEMEGAGGFRRRVALKLLNQSWEPGSDAARRLRDEARLLGRLDHPGIVRVDDLVLVEGRWALVMEHVGGADLERVFAWSEETGRALAPRAVAELGAAVAGALDAAWNAPGEDGAPLRVVHRDIKPSNVRLAEAGRVKVLDFGVARAAFSGREARTERVRYGSLGYMAPERLLGEPDTPAGDVYALGVMLYELLTATLYGRAELGLDRQRAQVEAARAALVARTGDSALVTLIEGMLAYAPDERPSAAELAQTLQLTADTLGGADLAQLARDVLPDLPPSGSDDDAAGRVLRENTGGASGPGPQVSSATLVLDPAAPAPPRALPLAAILGGFALVVVLGAGGWLVVTGGSTTTEAPPGATPAAPPPSATPAEAPPVADAARMPAPSDAPAAPLPAAAAPPDRPAPEASPAVPPTERAARADRAAALGADTPSSGPSAKVSSAADASPTVSAAPVGAAPPSTASGTPDAAAASSVGGTRLRAAKFTLTGASNLAVTCGDVTGSGVSSALLRNFPAGDCTVTAAGHTTRVRLDEPRGVACLLEGDSLACR